MGRARAIHALMSKKHTGHASTYLIKYATQDSLFFLPLSTVMAKLVSWESLILLV